MEDDGRKYRPWIVILVLLYILTPVDFFPGPVDDLIAAAIGVLFGTPWLKNPTPD